MTKPMLACDWDENKIVFPVIAQPKIDGVRGLNMGGKLTGRSLKTFKNRYVTNLFSKEYFSGFDGELAAEKETHPDLCRLTTSAIGTIQGEPFLLWWVFDYITEETIKLPYAKRYVALKNRVLNLQSNPAYRPWAGHLRTVEIKVIENLSDLLEFDEYNLEKGYEGTIIRDPAGRHKQGRSTVREGGLLRIKRFVESEAVVRSIVEGEMNNNEAQINELGLQFRSSHQQNKVPNGLVGNLQCDALETIRNSEGSVIVEEGGSITVSPGNMSHEVRAHYFKNQHEIIGKTIKFKFFPKGVKDKPRFPTFVTIRQPEDM